MAGLHIYVHEVGLYVGLLERRMHGPQLGPVNSQYGHGEVLGPWLLGIISKLDKAMLTGRRRK
jgi:hypothetical protein